MIRFPIKSTACLRRAKRTIGVRRQQQQHQQQEQQRIVRYLAGSSSGRSAAQTYLEGWVGLPSASSSPTTTTTTPTTASSLKSQNGSNGSIHNPVLRARAAMGQGPMLLSSSSYLLPTLRLAHNESPESLTARLGDQASSLDQALTTNGSTINDHNAAATDLWCCPIILDVSALAPDGSPHFQPPPPGSLTEMIGILRTYGMQVTGVTSSGRIIPLQLSEEANQAGIPNVRAPGTTRATDPKFDVAQILQMVRARNDEERLRNPPVEDDDGKSSDAKEAITPAPVIASSNDKQEKKETSTINVTTKFEDTKEDSIVSKQDMPTGQKAASDPVPPVPIIEFSSRSTLYHGSVRSGQQVMSSKGQSLVILGSVNSGGEVMSEGDIFVFGKLRGRAFAGLGGGDSSKDGKKEKDDESTTSSARIVATSFDAELVAIEEAFTTIDRVEDLAASPKLRAGQPIMVTLAGSKHNGETQTLTFAPVNL